MKYCEDYAALLDLFVDGELPVDEMERVQAHLETCSGCQSYLDDALAIRAGFPNVEETVVPKNFTKSVMDRVRKESGKCAEQRRQSVRRWTRTLAALAACCALVVLVETGGVQEKSGDTMESAGASGGGESTVACTSAGGAETPADNSVDGEEEYGIAPQMMDSAADTTEKEMETIGARTAAGAKVDVSDDAAADHEEYSVRMTPAAESAFDGSSAALRLTVGEAGDFLDGFVPVWTDDAERHYELNAEEYRALLNKLGREDEPMGSRETVFLVVVTEDGGS